MSENVAPKKLSPRQNKALAVLLLGCTKQEAAAVAGVTPKTIERWTGENVAFHDELQRRSGQAVQDATRRLTGTLDMAVDVFREVMEDKETPASVRLRAGNYAATHALRLLEVSEVLRRLDELEAKVVANNAQRSY